MRDYWHLWLSALFLRQEAYEYQRDRRDSFAHGLVFIVLVGVVVALAAIAGAGLRYATEPSADAIKNVVLRHLENMPFFDQMGTAGQARFQSGYNQTWDALGSLFVGYPTNAAGVSQLFGGIITTPLFWIIGWVLYGALAHLIAGRGSQHTGLAHGLGTLALATAPQALNVINLLPGAAVSGVAVALWTMIANVVALRTAYRVSTRRAVWAALFPLLLLLLLFLLLFCFTVVVVGALVRGGVHP